MAATTDRSGKELRPPVLSEREAEMAKAAQRCIVAALDHSRAPSIGLVDERAKEPMVRLPPKALRLVAQVLGAMAERKPFTVVPHHHELTTVEAAHFLNVSRPFVIKEIEAGHLRAHKVGSHRRISYEHLAEYKRTMLGQQKDALQRLADSARELGLGY